MGIPRSETPIEQDENALKERFIEKTENISYNTECHMA